jgi:hypothetical protein
MADRGRTGLGRGPWPWRWREEEEEVSTGVVRSRQSSSEPLGRTFPVSQMCDGSYDTVVHSNF